MVPQTPPSLPQRQAVCLGATRFARQGAVLGRARPRLLQLYRSSACFDPHSHSLRKGCNLVGRSLTALFGASLAFPQDLQSLDLVLPG